MRQNINLKRKKVWYWKILQYFQISSLFFYLDAQDDEPSTKKLKTEEVNSEKNGDVKENGDLEKNGGEIVKTFRMNLRYKIIFNKFIVIHNIVQLIYRWFWILIKS